MKVSVLDIFKIGIGPSSSHTLGPWIAAYTFRNYVLQETTFEDRGGIVIDLYGSLAHTGIGHGTDFALLMGLSGYVASMISPEELSFKKHSYKQVEMIQFSTDAIPFSTARHINYWKGQSLKHHSNGMTFRLLDKAGNQIFAKTYYSVGGGFVVSEEEFEEQANDQDVDELPSAAALSKIHHSTGKSLIEIITEHELQFRSFSEIEEELLDIYEVMLRCAYDGCHIEGTLPGGLNVERRAKAKHDKLMPHGNYSNPSEWLDAIRSKTYSFRQTIDWVSCFAISVNEQNADFGKVVTAPTNGAAGVIPAIIIYIQTLLDIQTTQKDIIEFMLIAGLIGQLYKHGATISAAAGGCQAEIGVSSSMAAAGLVHTLGGSPDQVFIAAEIAMEHHLGLTCDPVNGLVQVPCIERNSIGAMKAITSAQLAMYRDPSKAKVSLDQVIKSMWETAQDMNEKYRETSLGGLAVNVLLPEC